MVVWEVRYTRCISDMTKGEKKDLAVVGVFLPCIFGYLPGLPRKRMRGRQGSMYR